MTKNASQSSNTSLASNTPSGERTPDSRATSGATDTRAWTASLHHNAPIALDHGLYVVATPIGNLQDITLRALDVLAGADVIAAEDTRVTRKLLDRYGLVTPVISYHDHNAAEMRPVLLDRLAGGATVALVSDAGTPLISDPGYKLVTAVTDAGHPVIPIPGPSALTAALTTAALPTDRFMFLGFLPSKSASRISDLEAVSSIDASLVMYEAPARLQDMLTDCLTTLGDRPAAVCRELTKKFETVKRAPLSELVVWAATDATLKGEIVVVIGPAGDTAQTEVDLEQALRDALAHNSVKDAVALVAGAHGLSRKVVYQRALELRADDTGS